MNLVAEFLKNESKSKPDWSNQFKHANQMDKASYFFAEFVWQNKDVLKKHLPDVVYLSSPESSFFSDKKFIGGVSLRSPSKFIYTLPSVKVNVLCALLEWEGPVYNFMDDLPLEQVTSQVRGKSWRIVFNESEEKVRIEFLCSEGNKPV